MDDQTFDQLLAALREGPALIEAQVRAVPAEHWDDVVHGGEGGWTRRQLLAHMAANDQRQLTRVRVGAGIGDASDAAALAEQDAMDDAWNQQQVALRDARSVAELLAEMQALRGQLLSLLHSLTPEQRARQMPFRRRLAPLTEMVPKLLGHLAQHALQIAAP